MKRILLLLSILLLTACGGSQNASMLIDDAAHSLSVIRKQAYLGSEWTTEFVVSRYPECMRRHPLKGVVADKLKLDVYRVEAGVFILNAGKRWYVSETKTCRLEQYDNPPPEPGELIGTFQIKDGQLTFVGKVVKSPAGDAVAPAPAPAAGGAAPQ